MNRRAFVTGLGAVLAVPRGADAQLAAKPSPRIGFLSNSDPQISAPSVAAFLQGLRDLGWIEGHNVRIEYRWAEGKVDRIPGLAAELVRLKVDVIVTAGVFALRALQQATKTIPIVSAAILVDPVRRGLVASLARPGGNITGLASQYEEIVTKQVQLLGELVPQLSRIMILNYDTGDAIVLNTAASAADKQSFKAQLVTVNDPAQFEAAFKAAHDARVQVVLVLPNPVFNAHRRRLINLAASYRLPTLYEFREYVEDGGLISYGLYLPDMFRRAASYVDRIVNGAKPGDLPMERPAKFELVINMRTAKALGLTIPPSLLLRADQVIDP